MECERGRRLISDDTYNLAHTQLDDLNLSLDDRRLAPLRKQRQRSLFTVTERASTHLVQRSLEHRLGILVKGRRKGGRPRRKTERHGYSTVTMDGYVSFIRCGDHLDCILLYRLDHFRPAVLSETGRCFRDSNSGQRAETRRPSLPLASSLQALQWPMSMTVAQTSIHSFRSRNRGHATELGHRQHHRQGFMNW
jgi:hypothetical protein